MNLLNDVIVIFNLNILQPQYHIISFGVDLNLNLNINIHLNLNINLTFKLNR